MSDDRRMLPLLPTPEEMDDAVERWHNGAGKDLEIYEYFGWSEREYSDWVSDSSLVQPLRHPRE